MARRLLRVSVLTMLTFSLLLGGGSAGADGAHSDPRGSLMALFGSVPSQASAQPELRSTIAFASTRDNPSTGNTEIYLMSMRDDGTQDPTRPPRRLTYTPGDGEAYGALPPNGKRIVFDSNRLRTATEPLFTSDLFVMDSDSDELHAPAAHLVRGSSPTWSPHSNFIAFHASASGSGTPINRLPGAATTDSDIFVLNVDDCLTVKALNGVDDCRKIPGEHLKNITQSGNGTKEFLYDDADWSPDGTAIAFTGHSVSDPGGNPANPDYPSAEVYLMRVNPNGTPLQAPQPLTSNSQEDRAPAWSPNGERIVYMCRRNPDPGTTSIRFQLCIMDKHKVSGTWDGTWVETQLTFSGQHLTPSWSPDGTQILFHRQTSIPLLFQLFLIKLNQNGTACTKNPDGTCIETQLTLPPGFYAFAKWGLLRSVDSGASAVPQPSTSASEASPLPQRRER